VVACHRSRTSRRGQLRALRRVEREIADSEPGLYAFFLSFNRRAEGRDMPRTEDAEDSGSGRLRRLARRRRGRTLTERMKDWCAENWNDP
jgi:hypothetical protein